MYVMVRESAVAHFLEENIQVVTRLGANPGRVGFCTDDVTATSLLGGGHLDRLVRMAIAAGVPPVTAIQMATINTAQMYRIDHLVGSICPGRAADVVVIDDLAGFVVDKVVSKGVLVAEGRRALRPPIVRTRGPALLDTMKRNDSSPTSFVCPPNFHPRYVSLRWKWTAVPLCVVGAISFWTWSMVRCNPISPRTRST